MTAYNTTKKALEAKNLKKPASESKDKASSKKKDEKP
jgi:hypothetical protein